MNKREAKLILDGELIPVMWSIAKPNYIICKRKNQDKYIFIHMKYKDFYNRFNQYVRGEAFKVENR